MLQMQNVTVRYDGRTVVQNVALSLQAGQWLMLAGPNGAGKTTLLRAIAQGVAYEGQILLDGQDLRTMKPALRARRVALLSQQHAPVYDQTVEEIVALGRYSHAHGLFGGGDAQGAHAVDEALRMTGMEALRRRSIRQLSGGEVQRAFLAQVFAQQPDLLLLDEPANHLDPAYRQAMFAMVQQWLQTPGRAVLCVAHDLALARRFGTHAALMHNGRCVRQGEAHSAFDPQTLRQVYGMDVAAWMRSLYEPWM